MKKMICLILVALAVAIHADVPAGYGEDLLLNREGKEDVRGFTFREWFAAIGNYCDDQFLYNQSAKKQSIINSDAVYFQEQARELILWETKKALKKEIFSLGFFQPRQSPNYWWHYRDYFIQYPLKDDNELSYMMFLYLFSINGNGVSSRIQQGLYASGEFGQALLQKADERKMAFRSFSPIDFANLDKIKKELSTINPISYAAIRERNYNHKLNSLDNNYRTPVVLLYYPPDKVVNDLIDRKLITEHKRKILFQCAAAIPKIDDATAAKLMPFLNVVTCDTRDPKYKYRPDNIGHFYAVQNDYMLDLAGKNAAIDRHLQQILADFMPIAKYQEAIPAVQLLRRGTDEDLVLALNIARSKSLDCQPLFQRYATLFGSQEQAYTLWLRVGTLLNKAFPGIYSPDDKSMLQSYTNTWAGLGLFLLEKDGDLSLESGRTIIIKVLKNPDSMFSYPQNELIMTSLQAKFAPLLEKEFFTDPTTSNAAIRLSSMFPFENLNAGAQRWLIEYYFRNLANHKNFNLPIDVCASLLAVHSPIYQKEICNRLFNEYVTGDNPLLFRQLLNGGGSAYVPELLRLAGVAEPDDAVKAIGLIGDVSLYARQFSPSLMQLAMDAKTDFSLRIAILCTLGEINAVDCIPFIEKYTTDKNKMVAKAARQSLVLLKKIETEKDLPSDVMIKPEILKAVGVLRQ